MKKGIILVFILFSYSAYSQIINAEANLFNGRSFFDDPQYTAPFSGFTRIDYATFKIRDDKKIEGSPYAFENWENKGVIEVDNRKYKLTNINFNMRTNTIESKVGKDSVYIFDLNGLDHAFINNRKFKSYYLQKKRKNEVFELLYDGKDFNYLKAYEVGIKRPEIDPTMVRKPTAKYFTTKTYYIQRGIDIKLISLKKKEILPLFGNKSNEVATFVKENKLSYKKELDLKKILRYYDSL